MPGDIVNLRRVRKAKARAERERLAAEDRAAFGLTKEDKLKAKAEKAWAETALDRHRRESDD